MIKIKVSIPGFGNNLSLAQFLGNNDNCYDDCQFFVNDSTVEAVDFWFVIDGLQQKQEQVKVSPENVYFLSAEVVYPRGYYDTPYKQAFLDQFAHIITCHDIFRDNATYDLPFLGWMINANHGPSVFGETIRDMNWLRELKKVKKSKLLSVFCSAKTITPEHHVRLKFVKKLKEHFGDQLDWFGSGVQSIPQKWDGIAPYKYHIVLENQSRHNIITEKLYDSYLGLAYPIYWGAPNVGDYFSKKSFSPIEILDLHGSIDLIEKLIKTDLWRSRRTDLIESKQRVVLDLNPFMRILRIAKNRFSDVSDAADVRIYNHNISYDINDFLYRLGSKIIRLSR